MYWWSLHEGTVVPMRAVARHFDDIVAGFPRYQRALQAFQGRAGLPWGREDHVPPFDRLSGRFAADLRIPGERVRAIEGAKHFLQEDHAQEVAAAIVGLMESR